MNVLDGIDADVAAAVADIFRDGTHHYTGAMVSDGRGGQTRTKATQAVKALVIDFRAYVRATAGIPSNERKVMVQGYLMSPTPSPDDIIVQGDEAWHVIEVTKDPADAVFTCRCRPVAIPAPVVTTPTLVDATATAVANAGSDLTIIVPVDASASAIADAGVPAETYLIVDIYGTEAASADFMSNLDDLLNIEMPDHVGAA